jgi:hypothetical protein
VPGPGVETVVDVGLRTGADAQAVDDSAVQGMEPRQLVTIVVTATALLGLVRGAVAIPAGTTLPARWATGKPVREVLRAK